MKISKSACCAVFALAAVSGWTKDALFVVARAKDSESSEGQTWAEVADAPRYAP